MVSSLLESAPFNLLKTGYVVGLDWLGEFAKAIIEGIGIIGVGIIVFALVLKAITLPADIYQRVKMRKQALIMRNMQPELEKLQKQYANDSKMYSQKMSELYKKNGYSILGACLPMILSLVILIVAFQGFRAYADYANLMMYHNMSEQYNAAILDYCTDGGYDVTKEDKKGEYTERLEYSLGLTLDGEELVWEETKEPVLKLEWEEGAAFLNKDRTIQYTMYLEKITVKETDEDGKEQEVEKSYQYMKVESTDVTKVLYYIYPLEAEDFTNDCRQYKIDTERLEALVSAPEDKPKEDWTLAEKAALSQEEKDTIAQIRQDTDDAIKEINEKNEGDVEKLIKEAEENCANRINSVCINHVVAIGAQNAADWYRGEGAFEGEHNDAGFLWVKNIWYPDVSYSHPIQSYSGFQSQLSTKVTFGRGENVKKVPLSSVLNETQYNNLTSKLESEKHSANGYFILIILSIGFMVLSQFISMRSQKETSKYQTVDGRGARTQKVMMIVMPLIYAVFAFLYSAAFSIYMTMSSIISLIVTLLSNLILGKVFKKKEEQAIKEQYSRTLPWQKNGKNAQNGKNKNKDKKKK